VSASSRYVYLPPQSPRLAVLSPRVSRQIYFVARKSVHELGVVRELKAALIAAAKSIRLAMPP